MHKEIPKTNFWKLNKNKINSYLGDIGMEQNGVERKKGAFSLSPLNKFNF